MASINYATREISCKIVYYGPGLSGKTTNLQIIHRKIPDKDKSEMVSLATETDRTLFFDFLPLDLGSIKGFSTKFQLYTVPGQVYYNATRKLVLRGVDGVVFVVDSQVDKLQENLESFANLQENLREYGHSIENIPLVLQYNKRDLPNVYSIEQLNSLLNKHKLPHYEAVAATGVGVFTTLKAIGKSVIDKFNAKYAGFQGTRRPARPEAPAAPAAPAPRPAAPAPSFGQAPKPAFGGSPPTGPQPFHGVPGAPGGLPSGAFGNPPQAPGGFGAPPQGGAPGFGAPQPQGNPFGGNPGGMAGAMPTSAGFPGQMPTHPQPAPVRGPAPGGQGLGGFAPPGFGGQPGNGPGTTNPGFGMGSPNPFAGPAQPAAPRPGFPGAPVGGPGPSMPGGNPGFGGQPPAMPNFPGPKPMATGAPGGIPQQAGNTGFTAPPGIPVSPFVDSFGNKQGPGGNIPATPGMGQAPGGGFGAPGFGGGAPANPFMGGPAPQAPAGNPFGGTAPGGPGGFGQPQPMPGPVQTPIGGGFSSSFPSSPGAQNPLQGGPAPMGNATGFGGAPPGFGGFGGPTPQSPGMPGMPMGTPSGGFNPPMSGGFGAPPAGNPGSPFQAPGMPAGQGPGQNPGQAPVQGKGPPYPTLQPPTPEPIVHGKNLGNIEDNSGIVTTFEDLAKDDSFKTKKLPHPSEKKKGFFDGLFKKEK